jgi:DNA-binding protein HU-beta
MGMPEIGDRIEVASSKSGPRTGTVAAINDTLITVRWDSGEQTSLIPGPGVLNVIANGQGRKPASKQATATEKTQLSKSPTLSPSSKTRVSGSTVSVKQRTASAKKPTTKATKATTKPEKAITKAKKPTTKAKKPTTKASAAAKKAAPTKTPSRDSPRTGTGRRAR